MKDFNTGTMWSFFMLLVLSVKNKRPASISLKIYFIYCFNQRKHSIRDDLKLQSQRNETVKYMLNAFPWWRKVLLKLNWS